jgi:hypothetical protein
MGYFRNYMANFPEIIYRDHSLEVQGRGAITQNSADGKPGLLRVLGLARYYFREPTFRATRWLVRTLTGTYGLPAASRDAYRASNLSKRNPEVPSSVSKARNVSPRSFVF